MSLHVAIRVESSLPSSPSSEPSSSPDSPTPRATGSGSDLRYGTLEEQLSRATVSNIEASSPYRRVSLGKDKATTGSLGSSGSYSDSASSCSSRRSSTRTTRASSRPLNSPRLAVEFESDPIASTSSVLPPTTATETLDADAKSLHNNKTVASDRRLRKRKRRGSNKKLEIVITHSSSDGSSTFGSHHLTTWSPPTSTLRAISSSIPLTCIATLCTTSISVLSSLVASTAASSFSSSSSSALAIWSHVRIVPASTIHLLHPRSITIEYGNALFSVFLVPSMSSGSEIALGAINMCVLASLEKRKLSRCASSNRRMRSRATVLYAVLLWSSIILIRVALGAIFGRGVGWAWPELLSSKSISSVGYGLAPLLLSVYIQESLEEDSSTSGLSLSAVAPPPTTLARLLPILLLSFNFISFLPSFLRVGPPAIGIDFWWGSSAVIVGLAGLTVNWCRQSFLRTNARSIISDKEGSSASTAAIVSILLLISLPLLSTLSAVSLASMSPYAFSLSLSSSSFISSPSPSTIATEAAFAKLFPAHDKLFTILLMTAPRPGDPEFLNRSLESWLAALPEPTTSSIISNRMRLIVYTHFSHHLQFDLSQQHFQRSSLWSNKVAKYVEWRRDPRCFEEGGDRLDQRLHVARGLEYATRSTAIGQEEQESSAYVVLTEDDFPLCPDRVLSTRTAILDESNETMLADDQQVSYRSILPTSTPLPSFSETWSEIMRVVFATNQLMPDSIPSFSSATALPPSRPPSTAFSQSTAGHCGVFFATGGSGLIIRTFLAKTMPALLLGGDDHDGVKRVAAALELERSGNAGARPKEADTPDLVIQDCLRGRLEACRICAPPSSSTSPSILSRLPANSVRYPFVIAGDRHGKSGLAGTTVLLQRHLGYNTSTSPGRWYGKEQWTCGWRQPFNGETDVLTL